MLSHRFSLLVLLSSSCCCYAFQLPFAIPFFNTKSHNILNGVSSSTPRIAIVGAGASGSSAAFWISKAKERFGIDVEVDVYEREAHVGGSKHRLRR
jgi:prenylcysteine oxidase/farnesylcysteine lyase